MSVNPGEETSERDMQRASRAGAAILIVMAGLGATGTSATSFLDAVETTIQRSILPNWVGIDWPEYGTIERILIDEGLALAFVPNIRVLQELLNAASASERRTIIGRRSAVIIGDCLEVLGTITTPGLTALRDYGTAAAHAIQQGHTEAGQALATNTLESLTYLFPNKSRVLMTSHAEDFNPDNFVGVEMVIFGGIYGTYGTYRPSKGAPVPFTFNRHASSHHVSRRQYSKRNATIALMHLVALAKGIDFGVKLGEANSAEDVAKT